ncbi:HAD family hydrolase [Robiginitalea biformata]|uniref:HAD family hydrolase n=1 Tax=Robiginitalea biformata TaxID=252307 RepID=UPI003B5C69CE
MIKNLIFDFGDVIIDLDKEGVPRALAGYGLSGADPELVSWANQYEAGQMTSTEFLDRLGNRLGEPDREVLVRHWNTTIRHLPEGRLEFLENLRDSGGFRMFLLSNTNELHMACVAQQLGEETFSRLKACFEGFYLSYQIGMRKPEPGIFRHVLEENRLAPGETLFIDDTLEHILGARSLGIATWHLQVGQEDVRELKNRL